MGLSRRGLFCRIRCGWGWIGLSAVILAAAAVPAQDPPPASEAEAAAGAHDEGDTGQSESIDESGGTLAYQGPYNSPYKLTFSVPLHDLLFDAKRQGQGF
jgi:hypothetical protein